MWDLKPFHIYTLCSQEKNYFFNVGFKALSYIYSKFTRKKLCFFNVGFKALSYIYSKFIRKKLCFFNVGLRFETLLVYIFYVPKKKLFFQCEI